MNAYAKEQAKNEKKLQSLFYFALYNFSNMRNVDEKNSNIDMKQKMLLRQLENAGFFEMTDRAFKTPPPPQHSSEEELLQQ